MSNAELLSTPEELKRTRTASQWTDALIRRVIGLGLSNLNDVDATGAANGHFLKHDGTKFITGPNLASLTATGVVNQAAASANANVTAISITSTATSADANVTYDSIEQDMLNEMAVLTSELKTDVNTLINIVNDLVLSVNDLKAKMRTAGQLDS